MFNFRAYYLAALVTFLIGGTAWAAPTDFDQAVQDYNSRKYSQALSTFKKVLAGKPQDARTHYYMALCYQALSQIASAENEYKWVSDNSPDQHLKDNARQALKNIQGWTSHRTSSGQGNDFKRSSTPSQSGVPLRSLEPRIVDRPAEQALGLGASCMAKNPKDVSRLWDRFTPRIAEIPNPEGTYTLGVSSASTLSGIRLSAGSAFVYVAAVPVKSLEQVPEGMVKVQIPAGRYAVFTHAGLTSDMHRSLDYIWKTWLPRAAFKYREAPFIELYDRQRFNADSRESEIDLYVPIK